MTTFSDEAAREVQATIKDMEDAYVARDLDRFASYFTDDIVAMPPGRPPVVGIEAWRELLTEFHFGSDVSNHVSKSEDITVVGDWAIEWHNEAATYTSKDSGEPQRVYNKGMFIFHNLMVAGGSPATFGTTIPRSNQTGRRKPRKAEYETSTHIDKLEASKPPLQTTPNRQYAPPISAVMSRFDGVASIVPEASVA